MIIIGIDPGKAGALVAMGNNGSIKDKIIMPIAGKELDIPAITKWLNWWLELKEPVIACVEKVHAMPGQGVVSMFTFGFNVGVIRGVISALNITLYLVAPQTWKKVVLADTPKDKNAAIDYCSRVYPEVSLLATERSKKPHQGIADAICIARYALETCKFVL